MLDTDIDTQTHTRCNLKAQRDNNGTVEIHHLLTECCLDEAFPKKIPARTKQSASAMTYQTHNKTVLPFDP